MNPKLLSWELNTTLRILSAFSPKYKVCLIIWINSTTTPTPFQAFPIKFLVTNFSIINWKINFVKEIYFHILQLNCRFITSKISNCCIFIEINFYLPREFVFESSLNILCAKTFNTFLLNIIKILLHAIKAPISMRCTHVGWGRQQNKFDMCKIIKCVMAWCFVW